MKQTILIRDVQLVQGGISPRCDMLIQDGVIAKLGKDLNESAHFVIDGSRLRLILNNNSNHRDSCLIFHDNLLCFLFCRVSFPLFFILTYHPAPDWQVRQTC